MNEATFIILGATGDLTKRKLIPAIYKLVEDKKIQNFSIIGAALSDTTIDQILKHAKEFIPKPNTKIWEKIKKQSYYQKVDFYKTCDWPKLKTLINKVENKHKLNCNKIFYLATS